MIHSKLNGFSHSSRLPQTWEEFACNWFLFPTDHTNLNQNEITVLLKVKTNIRNLVIKNNTIIYLRRSHTWGVAGMGKEG